jgi:hypothetical protein
VKKPSAEGGKKPTDAIQYKIPAHKIIFVDDAAGLALAAPALEGGLILHLCTLSLNVLRA